MCVRNLGFVLLIWFPGVLRAQSETQSCRAPRIAGGFFAPVQETYLHGAKLTYTCDDGRKPPVKGWWATSTCRSGNWSHKPQRIDIDACIPPKIPNAKYTGSPNGWYREGHKIRITCDSGYEAKDRHDIAVCTNGTWSPVPVCEKCVHACSEPPKIPHAVIIHQDYQEVFAADSEVRYECQDGYTAEGADDSKSVFCIAGNWTEGPECSRTTGSGTVQGGSTAGGSGGGDVGSAASGTQPAAGGRGTGSGAGGTQPASGGTSSTSGTNGREGTQFRPISHCGAYPHVPNAAVVPTTLTSLQYQCVAFYKIVGEGTVMCLSDGTWSQLPVCKAAFCVLNRGQYVRNTVRVLSDGYLKEGDKKRFQCLWVDWFSSAQCSNGEITFSSCCSIYDMSRGHCS